MTNSRKTIITAAAAIAALCAPVAAQAHGGENGHGHSQRAPRAPKPMNVIVKGSVVAVDGNVVTVAVTHANHHGRAFVGQQVQLDVSGARVSIEDVNADGSRNLADAAAGDRVVAQLRVDRGVTPDLTQAFATRRLVDVGPAPAPTPES
jgi:hypothetical protein